MSAISRIPVLVRFMCVLRTRVVDRRRGCEAFPESRAYNQMSGTGAPPQRHFQEKVWFHTAPSIPITCTAYANNLVGPEGARVGAFRFKAIR